MQKSGHSSVRIRLERLTMDGTVQVSSYEIERWFVDDADAQAALMGMLEVIAGSPVHTGSLELEDIGST